MFIFLGSWGRSVQPTIELLGSEFCFSLCYGIKRRIGLLHTISYSLIFPFSKFSFFSLGGFHSAVKKTTTTREYCDGFILLSGGLCDSFFMFVSSMLYIYSVHAKHHDDLLTRKTCHI